MVMFEATFIFVSLHANVNYLTPVTCFVTVSRFKWSDADFLQRSVWFNPGLLHVRFVVDGFVTEAQFIPRFLRFPPIIITLLLLHAYLLPPPESCHVPDQAAQYHNRGFKLTAPSLSWHLACYKVRRSVTRTEVEEPTSHQCNT
jgi:hypothetical protein